MNSFRQHIPAFVEMDRPAAISFETTADLLALDVVQRYIGPKHSHFAMSDNTLMEISDDGYHWWVVGFIEQPELIELPKWEGWKHLARLADGREVTLTDEVVSSCGGQLTLRDGSIATDVRYERQMAKQAADRELERRGICPNCEVNVVTTRSDDEKMKTKTKMTRIEETCPRCGRRTTRWEPK